jgi:protein-tyrosine phosphatase
MRFRHILLAAMAAFANPLSSAPAESKPVASPSVSTALESVPNFRDLGGYNTRDHRVVRPGLLLRSDQLDHVSDADLARMAQMRLETVIDLRTDAERAKGADRVPPGVRHVDMNVLAEQSLPAAIMQQVATRGGEAVMIDIYREIAGTEKADTAYRNLLARVGTAKGPTLFHCTAGKDRTGWGAAVILTLLGVPRETVIADFMTSNARLARKNEAIYANAASVPRAMLEPVMTVRRVYIETAFAEVERRFGSFDAYAKTALGMDRKAIKRLRTHYLVRG